MSSEGEKWNHFVCRKALEFNESYANLMLSVAKSRANHQRFTLKNVAQLSGDNLSQAKLCQMPYLLAIRNVLAFKPKLSHLLKNAIVAFH